MQRLRVRYAKRGRLRFTSHRDIQRALERAVRRAGIPVARSAGFNPHPRISYANAVPTGASSEAEYLEIGLTRVTEPTVLRDGLDGALPDGLDVIDVAPAHPPALMDRLEASWWRIELPGLRSSDVQDALVGFLASDRVEVQRRTRAGIRTFDARGAVVRAWTDPGGAEGAFVGTTQVAQGNRPTTDADVAGPAAKIIDCVAQGAVGSCAILHLVVRHTTPAVRPDDVLTALRSQARLAPPSPAKVTRLAQGPLDRMSGVVADPLTTDQDVDGT
ncbi:MAG: hypothetical protein QG608_1918 [Actinomycetota bacterium]|nr:hypothetical protein [Actinomycetota bacterium]